MSYPVEENAPRDLAYSNFTEKLLSRQLRPGQFLAQRELAAITGLPLGAIREIVPRLEAEGLMKTMPGRGMQIAPIDLNLIREAFQFRLIVEREAVAQFALAASKDELSELRHSHEQVLALANAKALTQEQNDAAQMLDWQMHDIFVNSLRNSIVSKAYVVNSVKIRLIHNERYRIEGRVAVAMHEHLEIITALEQRDQGAAVGAITRHIENARRIALDP